MDWINSSELKPCRGEKVIIADPLLKCIEFAYFVGEPLSFEVWEKGSVIRRFFVWEDIYWMPLPKMPEN